MNDFLNKLERRFGRYAVHRLTGVLIICYVIGYIISFFAPQMLDYMYLDPVYILRGQIWRLITWIIVPPSSAIGYNLFFAVIMLFFYFSIGSTLERAWGDFKYNVYIFGGLLISIIAAFISYFVLKASTGLSVSIGGVFSTYYICMSILLAFAFTFPDMRVMLWFVIPLKVKWLGIVYALFMGYDIIKYIRAYSSTGYPQYIVACIAILASLANFIIFYLSQKGRFKRGSRFQKEYKRYDRYDRKTTSSNAGSFAGGKTSGTLARHRCHICGRTDVTDPDLEFRFCSKCKGGLEYCSEHIFTHQHVL